MPDKKLARRPQTSLEQYPGAWRRARRQWGPLESVGNVDRKDMKAPETKVAEKDDNVMGISIHLYRRKVVGAQVFTGLGSPQDMICKQITTDYLFRAPTFVEVEDPYAPSGCVAQDALVIREAAGICYYACSVRGSSLQ